MLLKGHTAIITGAGRGIGRSITEHLAREGANVVLVSRNQAQLEDAASRLSLSTSEFLIVPTDVSDLNQVTSCIEKVIERFGTVDILVNNAGISIERPFLETTPDDWEHTLNVNLYGVLNCTRVVLPHMIKRRRGKIVNISSGAGLRGLPGSSAYAASKAAVIAFGSSLAGEMESQGIQVNTICPGPILTEMFNNSAVRDSISNASNLQPPEDVAGLTLFLASSLSGKTSGQVFNVRNSNRW